MEFLIYCQHIFQIFFKKKENKNVPLGTFGTVVASILAIFFKNLNQRRKKREGGVMEEGRGKGCTMRFGA